MSLVSKKKIAQWVLRKYPEADEETFKLLTASYLQESRPVVQGLGRRCSVSNCCVVGTVPPILEEQQVHPTTGEVQSPEASYELGETFRSKKEPIRFKMAKDDGKSPAHLSQDDN